MSHAICGEFRIRDENMTENIPCTDKMITLF